LRSIIGNGVANESLERKRYKWPVAVVAAGVKSIRRFLSASEVIDECCEYDVGLVDVPVRFINSSEMTLYKCRFSKFQWEYVNALIKLVNMSEVVGPASAVLTCQVSSDFRTML